MATDCIAVVKPKPRSIRTTSLVTSVSSTLVPPSHYVVKPPDRPARLYNTISEVATAIYLLAPTPATVSVLTGNRGRSLTDAELRSLGRDLRAVRLHGDRTRPTVAAASAHEHRVPRR